MDKSGKRVVDMMWTNIEQVGVLVNVKNLFREFSTSAQKLSTEKICLNYLILIDNNVELQLSTGLISH